jgi:hypothetical protein
MVEYLLAEFVVIGLRRRFSESFNLNRQGMKAYRAVAGKMIARLKAVH